MVSSREKIRQKEVDLSMKIEFCEFWGQCHKTLWLILGMAVLGIRSLMLGFGSNSESFIVELHEKCSWGGEAQELILKM